jgi:hypothetical protein
VKIRNAIMKLNKVELEKLIQEEIANIYSVTEVAEPEDEEMVIEEGIENVTPENIGIAIAALKAIAPLFLATVGGAAILQKLIEKLSVEKEKRE